MLLVGSVAAVAQTPPSDPPMAQALLSEIRQLRNDLQMTAATIQRVQIVMYRLQSQASVLDRVTQRLDLARAGCTQTQEQRNMFAAQIQQTETRMRDGQSLSDHKSLSSLKSSAEALTAEEQKCQLEVADAENQVRAEQAKMNDLQDHLDKLDRVLAGYGSK
jgi:chromosome segregation ATPase